MRWKRGEAERRRRPGIRGLEWKDDGAGIIAATAQAYRRRSAQALAVGGHGILMLSLNVRKAFRRGSGCPGQGSAARDKCRARRHCRWFVFRFYV